MANLNSNVKDAVTRLSTANTPNTPKMGTAKEIKRSMIINKLASIEKQIALEFVEGAKSALAELINQDARGFDLPILYRVAHDLYLLRSYKQCLNIIAESPLSTEVSEDVHLKNLKGMCHMKLEELETAEKLFLACLERDPKFTSSLNNLGNICMNRREYKRSLEYFSIAKQSRLG